MYWRKIFQNMPAGFDVDECAFCVIICHASSENYQSSLDLSVDFP